MTDNQDLATKHDVEAAPAIDHLVDTTYNLVPGIHVYVFILTGERTVLSYITTPFHNGVGQALQER